MKGFKLYSSPLQGYTDYVFRNTFNKLFGGIDTFYAPYIRLKGELEIQSSKRQDILPENNLGVNIVPQIMTNSVEEFVYVARYIMKLGYNELNWNLGCPYPMVAKRKLGSGLIAYPEVIDKVLSRVYQKQDIEISIKLRLGYEREDEIFKLFPVLNKYPIKFIAIHPRIGKQLYKGKADLDAFKNCMNYTSHTLCYNGDVDSVSKFKELKGNLPTINKWMIGRGLLYNPFLPEMIKNGDENYPVSRLVKLKEFHDLLYDQYTKALSGPGHILTKMSHFWEYFSASFAEPHKAFKKIKKAKNISAYDDAVHWIFSNEAVY